MWILIYQYMIIGSLNSDFSLRLTNIDIEIMKMCICM